MVFYPVLPIDPKSVLPDPLLRSFPWTCCIHRNSQSRSISIALGSFPLVHRPPVTSHLPLGRARQRYKSKMGSGFLLLLAMYRQVFGIWSGETVLEPGALGLPDRTLPHWSLRDKTPTDFCKHCEGTFPFLICERTWGARFSPSLLLVINGISITQSLSGYQEVLTLEMEERMRYLRLLRHGKPLIHLCQSWTLDSEAKSTAAFHWCCYEHLLSYSWVPSWLRPMVNFPWWYNDSKITKMSQITEFKKCYLC